MSLETSVRECGAALGSSRATDRKKNGENLKNFLEGNAVPPMLSENTLRGRGYSWNELFDDINELVMKETEKYESSKTYETVSAPLCGNLLQLCVFGSIKGKAYIKCDKVVEACLFILRDKRLLKAIGDAYLNLLYKHVLLCDHYLNNITPSAWEELLETSLSICLSKNSKLDDFTKLRLLLLVMRNGRNSCQFVIPLRDSLSKLKLCFHALTNYKRVQEVVIEILILLLETLSVESRMTMCEFTENLLSPILKFYDQNLDPKKKASLFKLLRLIVSLHHPLGRTQQETGSLAHSWDVWNKYLPSILEVACLEVIYLQKQKKPQEILLKYCNEFYSLTASVYYQIFKLPVRRDQDEGENSSKRQRVTYNRNNCFGDLVEELRQNHVPWLSVITTYVNKYGESVSTKDYTTLLSVAEGLISNSTSNLDWNTLEELVCSTVRYLDSRAASKSDGADVLVSMWNSCVRVSTLVNATHKPMHSIIQLLLTLDILKYQHVQQLVKLYQERSMPVTDSSIDTLNNLFHKFFSKFNNHDSRMQCFTWLVNGQITSINVNSIKKFLLRLLANENVEIMPTEIKSDEDFHDIIFCNLEKSTLFSEFELDISEPKSPITQKSEQYELNAGLSKEIKEYFNEKFTEQLRLLNNKEVPILDFIQFVNAILCYLDIMLKNNLSDHAEIEKDPIFRLLKIGIQDMYWAVTMNLKNNTDIRVQIKLLQCLKNLLMDDYDKILSGEVRRAQTEFFERLNVIVNKKITSEDCVEYHEDHSVLDPHALRHICIIVLAAYCRKPTAGRTEILDFILDPKIYNFSASWDINCALECIEVLNGPEVEEPPLESVFFLMQGMCKELFKSSEATYKLLRVFLKMMDQIWSLEKEKQNCYIMVKGYLQRCEKKYYPPKVAALIYECAAKMAALSLKQNKDDMDNSLVETLQSKVKGDIHSIRLYSSYLLKYIVGYLPDNDITSLLEGFKDIFTINVAERKESVLKDESKNRTVTLLHTALSLVQVKKSLLNDIITELVQIQKEKSLDKDLTKKVLNKITNLIAMKNVETYFNDNVLFVLNFWFLRGNDLNSLPFFLFGFSDIEGFLEEHYKWAISADILWKAGGEVKNSAVFNLVLMKSGKPAADIIEACNSNMVALYIPYIVTNKYDLNYRSPGKREWLTSAHKVFESTIEILGTAKWSGLYEENLSELVGLVASHYRDIVAAKTQYNVDIPLQGRSYHYPKLLFDAILKDIGTIIEESVLEYLCENQALTIFKVLFQLWANVLDEKVFEYKVLCLHSFVTFLEMIPVNHPTDAFVANFACTTISHAIKDAQTKDETRVFVKALRIILEHYLPAEADMVRKPVLQLLSILMIKKDRGFEAECAPLLNYLTDDMKDCLKDGEDVIDFISSLSQGAAGNINCSTKAQFMEKLKTYKNSLSCPSHETLTNLREFLKLNRVFANKLCDDLNTKGFSDDCGTSVIHQVIGSLSNTLRSATDDKTVIEACNCLAEIGNYDLKTLVTVPPANTQWINSVPPRQYFAIAVTTALTEVLFDENPLVTNAVSKALKRLFQYKEGKMALDLEETNKEILIPLSSQTSNVWADFNINDSKFKSLLCVRSFWVPRDGEKHSQWLTRITSALIEVLASNENYLPTLQTVCKLKPNMCAKILSPLLGVLLECSAESHLKALSEIINQFFRQMWTLNQENRDENSEDSESRIDSTIDHEQKMIIQYMLDVVNFVRLQRLHYKARPDRTVESLNYLRLDYEKVSWVATVADQNLAAIYYAELWAIAQNNGVPPSSPEATTLLEGGESVQRILRKCFVSIGEMDAIDGCGTAHLTSEREKRKHLINTGQYSDALMLHDIALSCGGQIDPHLQQGVVKCLHKSGMHHLALQYIKSLPEDDSLNDVKYECLSFLGDWSDFVDTRDLEEKSKEPKCNPYSIIKAFRYSCLKDCLNIQPTTDFDTKLTLPLNRAKKAVAKLCQSLNMENCQNVYKVLSKLHQFSDIEDYFSVRSAQVSITSLLNRWQVENLPAFNDFKHLEALITQRSLVLEHAAKEYQTSLKDIVPLQLQYAELCLSNERIQMAQRLLAGVKMVQKSPEVALAESQISWAKGHKDIALSLLRNIVAHPSSDVRLNAVSLRQYGIWMAESKRDNARDIINKYLKKSLEVLSSSDHEETRLKVYYDIATFADAEYKVVVAYMNSSVYEKKVKVLNDMKNTVNSLRPTQQSLSRDEKKALQTNDKFGHLEEAEITNTKAEKETFLHLAMRYYLLSLKQSEGNDLSVFRVISLWLDNPGVRLQDGDADFEQLLHSIPSWKFISVLPQLAPRLTNDTCLFADNLRKLLSECYHLSWKFISVLPQLAPRLTNETCLFADNLRKLLSECCVCCTTVAVCCTTVAVCCTTVAAASLVELHLGAAPAGATTHKRDLPVR
ncbi:telomere-length maintenance and DNA damage repair domain-containing protein [Phthorimaea operculella]|nr:telomere-length maintenance and DNA damage repair domain-containing protein [Phthorimaea operculella]